MNYINKHKKDLLSIVIPVYFNEGLLWNTFNALNDVVSNIDLLEYEFIFINDGSTDKSLDELIKIKEEFPHISITIINLTRNFGQVPAIYAGYEACSGDCVVTISADLQEPPELIKEMIEKFRLNIDIVIAHREESDESKLKRIPSLIFYKTIQNLVFKNMPKGGFDFMLLSRRVILEILESNEVNPFWQGQILWTGYPIALLPYKRRQRTVGKSMTTFSKKVKYTLDGTLSYSYLPLRLMSVAGIVISLLGISYALFIFVMKLTGHITIEGWAPIMIAILLLAGFQIFSIGLLGEYLWRVWEQVKGRKKYIIKETFK